jgi:hypothetical protein
MIIDRHESHIVRFRLEPTEWGVRNGRAATDFLHEMRSSIPHEFRDFDFETCSWVVDTAYFDGTVGRLRQRYFKEVEV